VSGEQLADGGPSCFLLEQDGSIELDLHSVTNSYPDQLCYIKGGARIKPHLLFPKCARRTTPVS